MTGCQPDLRKLNQTTSHDSMALVMTSADTSHSWIVGVATEALEDEAKYLDLVVHGKV